MRRVTLPLLPLLVLCCMLAGIAHAQPAGAPDLEALLVRVEQAKEAQQAAIKQLELDRQTLSALTNPQVGELQPLYGHLFHAYNGSIETTVAVSTAVASVDQAAGEIFRQWEVQIAVLTDTKLKEESQTGFARMQRSYEDLIRSLRQSEAALDPILDSLKSNVTYFKYNLTPDGLAGRKAELLEIEQQITAAIELLNTSIASSEAFIRDAQR